MTVWHSSTYSGTLTKQHPPSPPHTHTQTLTRTHTHMQPDTHIPSHKALWRGHRAPGPWSSRDITQSARGRRDQSNQYQREQKTRRRRGGETSLVSLFVSLSSHFRECKLTTNGRASIRVFLINPLSQQVWVSHELGGSLYGKSCFTDSAGGDCLWGVSVAHHGNESNRSFLEPTSQSTAGIKVTQ